MKSFYIGVKAIILQDNKILLLKRVKQGTYFWDAPGGRIDEGEDIEDALRRELMEEIGSTDVVVGQLLEVYKLPHEVEDNRGLLLVFYEVQGEIKEVRLSAEHEDYVWVAKDEVRTFLQKEQGHVNEGTQKAILSVLS